MPIDATNATDTTRRLTDPQLAVYHELGHVTVPDVIADQAIETALADAREWADTFISELDDAQRQWYLERQASSDDPVLRKLDDPVFHRRVFRELASTPTLVAMVEQLIGPGVGVCFSQIFFKPPGIGGPKPVHQDNFYFGPNHLDGVVTAWLALDDATVENGCLYYGDGTHRGPVVHHEAPEGEPFNLLIPERVASQTPMTPAPVPRGGVSFHHGNTWHQSSDNRSDKWRRAAAMHFVNRQTRFTHPALPYDDSRMVWIT